MHLEIRQIGKKKKYYLAHSFRQGNSVKKIRRYLGEDLSQEKIKELMQRAEFLLLEKVKNYTFFRDPFKFTLNKEELEQLKKMGLNDEIKIKHLSENNWLKFSALFSYDTNAIEGSTITEKEAREIIEENKWPSDRTKWEISETYGVAEAIKYTRETKEHISLELIKKLHGFAFRNSKSFAGKFRAAGVEVVVMDKFRNIIHRGAPSSKVVELLNELIRWYDLNKKKYPAIVLAAVVHNQFENIHPFQDGNGRVGRLLLNNILLKHNMPPVNIEYRNREEYYSALQEYEHKGDLKPTIKLILKEYDELKKKLD